MIIKDNLPELVGITAVILSVISFIPYIRAILKKQTRPSGASWWTWTILTMITLTSSAAAGAPWQVLMLPLWLCLSQFFVAILSIKRGDNNWDLLNKLCIASALVSILIWLITGEPLLALMISIVADLMASIPNFRHVWTNPEQENRLGWTLGWGSAVLEIFAIKSWSTAESSWAIYFLINMSLVLFLLWRPKLKNMLE